METETRTSAQQIELALTKYNLDDGITADTAIAGAAGRAEALTIAGVDDEAGETAVIEARKDARKIRTGIEKTRKALKADALSFGRAVDGEARRLTELVEPIEAGLQEKLDELEHERGRAEREREAREAAFLKERIDELRKWGVTVSPIEEAIVATLGPEAYAEKLEAAKDAHEAEQRRKEVEAAALETERVRQREAREALEKERAELDAEKAKLAEERAANPPPGLTAAGELEPVCSCTDDFKDRTCHVHGESPLVAVALDAIEMDKNPLTVALDAIEELPGGAERREAVIQQTERPRTMVPVRVADAQAALDHARAEFDREGEPEGPVRSFEILEAFVEKIASAGR